VVNAHLTISKYYNYTNYQQASSTSQALMLSYYTDVYFGLLEMVHDKTGLPYIKFHWPHFDL